MNNTQLSILKSLVESKIYSVTGRNIEVLFVDNESSTNGKQIKLTKPTSLNYPELYELYTNIVHECSHILYGTLEGKKYMRVKVLVNRYDPLLFFNTFNCLEDYRVNTFRKVTHKIDYDLLHIVSKSRVKNATVSTPQQLLYCMLHNLDVKTSLNKDIIHKVEESYRISRHKVLTSDIEDVVNMSEYVYNILYDNYTDETVSNKKYNEIFKSDIRLLIIELDSDTLIKERGEEIWKNKKSKPYINLL